MHKNDLEEVLAFQELRIWQKRCKGKKKEEGRKGKKHLYKVES